MIVEGGVSKTVYPNYDKDGNIYYTDEQGMPIDNRVSLLQKLTNNVKAGLTNLDSWLNRSDYNPEVQKQKRAIALGAITAPIGLGTQATTALAGRLAPYVGSKIAQGVAEGVGSGALGGGIYGAGQSFIDDTNPLVGGLIGALSGSLAGGLTGYGLGQVGKRLAQNRLLNEPDSFANQYFNDFIADLADKSRDMAKYRGLRQGITKGAGSEVAFDLADDLTNLRDMNGFNLKLVKSPKISYNMKRTMEQGFYPEDQIRITLSGSTKQGKQLKKLYDENKKYKENYRVDYIEPNSGYYNYETGNMNSGLRYFDTLEDAENFAKNVQSPKIKKVKEWHHIHRGDENYLIDVNDLIDAGFAIDTKTANKEFKLRQRGD